jgi:hypothetical protein
MQRPWLVTGAALISLVAAGAAPARAQAPAGTASPAAPADVQQLRAEIERLRAEIDQLLRQYDASLQALARQVEKLESPKAGEPESSARGPRGAFSPVAGGGAPAPGGPAGPTSQQTPGEPTGQQTQAQVPPPTQPPPDQPPPPQPPAGLSSKVFNPDISVIGNFVGVAGKNDFSDQPAMQLSEAEVSFQAIVDPYAKADFFLSASPDGLEVEEGYITFTSLPKNLLLKVGKMRAQFGKVNTLHTHQMPTADRPLVTQNLVGGEDGISDAGMSLSYLLHNPVIFVDFIGEVYHSDSEVFQSTERSKLAYVGRVRAYRDITENSNIDVGTSFAFGPTDVGVDVQPPSGTEAPILDKRLFGIDATFRYRPLRRAIYQRLNLRTELIWSRQELLDDLQESSFGMYALGEYQFARRWYAGARYDRSARVLDDTLTDTGGSFFMTFWPTEFSQIRGQYRYTKYAEGITGHEFLFQFNFSIGAHGAHIF